MKKVLVSTVCRHAHREPRVFVVGLDGASPNLIIPWAKQGKLPNLKKLMSEGAFGELSTTILPVTPAAWTSFMTGKNPGKHGVFDFISRESGSYKFNPITCFSNQSEIVWNIIGRTGKKSIVINVPMTYPPMISNGVLISGFPAPESRKDYVFPNGLLKEIEREIGDYDVHYKIEFKGNNAKKFLDHIKSIIEKRASVAEYLMKSKEWDFFMIHFQATDWVQHFFWKYFDKDHPSHDPQNPSYLKNAILDTYRLIDEKIGGLLENLDEGTYKIIMSDHGFGPLYKVVYLNNFFREKGLLKFKSSLKYVLFKLGFTSENIYKLLTKLELANLVPRFRHKKYEVFKIFLGLSDVDWHKTRVYSIGHNGQVYINLAGREPVGLVNEGKEYEHLREHVIEILRNFRDPETNRNIFDQIYRREEIYHGPHLHEAPDIVAPMTSYNQEMNYISKKVLGNAPNLLSGYHRMNGFVLFSGPRIGKKVMKANIIDIAPTILYILRIPIPNDMDGKVLLHVFESEYVKSNPAIYTSRSFKERREREKLSYDSKEEIKERLKRLGYLG